MKMVEKDEILDTFNMDKKKAQRFKGIVNIKIFIINFFNLFNIA
jgi:hypothetical protein